MGLNLTYALLHGMLRQVEDEPNSNLELQIWLCYFINIFSHLGTNPEGILQVQHLYLTDDHWRLTKK